MDGERHQCPFDGSWLIQEDDELDCQIWVCDECFCLIVKPQKQEYGGSSPVSVGVAIEV